MSQATLDDVLRAHPGPLRIDGNGEAHGPCLCCGDGTDRWWAAERDGTLIVQCRRPECVATFEQHLEALGLRDAGPAGFGKHIEPKYGTGKGNVDWPTANGQPPAPPVAVSGSGSGSVTTHIEWMDLQTRLPVIQLKKDPPPPSWHGKYRWPAGTVKANLVSIHGNWASTGVVFHEGGFAAMAAAGRLPQFMHIGLPNAGTVPAVELLVELVKDRHVAIWPDYDAPGRKHGIKVAAHCRAAGVEKVRWIDPLKLGLTEKGHDAADWTPEGEPFAEFKAALTDVPDDDEQSEADTVRWRQLCDVIPRAIPWIWPKRIAAGAVTIINGDPSSGKSLFAATLAASVTRGRMFPDGTGAVPIEGGDVVWIGHESEDALDYVVRPRFEAASADLARVTCYDTDSDAVLADVCTSAANRRPLLAVIDSWAAWAGEGEDDAPVRARYRALKPLRDAGAGVLLITHSRKMAYEGNQMHMVSGSVQMTAGVRMVLEVRGKRDEIRGVYQTKGNLQGCGCDLSFEIEGVAQNTPGGDIDTARIAWLDTPPPKLKDSNISVAAIVDLLAGPEAPKQPTFTKIREAMNATSAPQQKQVKTAIHKAVQSGHLVANKERVGNADRDVYRLAE